MEISLALSSYKISLSLEKKGKRIITYLPKSDVLETLRKEDKGDFLSSDQAKSEVEKYQESLGQEAFWEKDEGYTFIERHLPKNKFSLLDVGCHVGQLPAYLIQKGRWNDITYTGTDIIGTFVDLAQQKYQEGDFFVSNIQEFITDKAYDVVFTKGTIISTFDPIKSTRNVLSVPSKQTFLLHTPISDFEQEDDFYNILVHSPQSVYTSSVLSRKAFDKVLEEKGFSIIAETKRSQKFNVLNKGSYHLYDFLLEKKS